MSVPGPHSSTQFTYSHAEKKGSPGQSKYWTLVGGAVVGGAKLIRLVTAAPIYRYTCTCRCMHWNYVTSADDCTHLLYAKYNIEVYEIVILLQRHSYVILSRKPIFVNGRARFIYSCSCNSDRVKLVANLPEQCQDHSISSSKMIFMVFFVSVKSYMYCIYYTVLLASCLIFSSILGRIWRLSSHSCCAAHCTNLWWTCRNISHWIAQPLWLRWRPWVC